MALPISRFQNLDLLSVGIVVAGMVILGFVTLLNNLKSVSNRAFFYLAMTAGAWGIVNYLSQQTYPIEISFFILRLVMFFGVWSSFFTFNFTYIFPSLSIKTSRYYKWIIVPLTTITAFLALTPLVFSGVSEITADGRILNVTPGPGIFIFAFTVIFLNIGGIVLLIQKIIKSSAEQRKSLQIILAGFIIMLSSILIFNFIFPAFFNNSRFVPLGALFMFPFIAATYYAIIKHKLFNIRIAGTAVLVFALSVISFIEVTQTSDFISIIYRSSVLFFTLVFGILLIRGVLKEVKQREEIAKMAEDVRRAYVIEKKAKEELEKLDKVKDQFVMITQHNLRTPLTSMMGYSDLLLKGVFGKQNKKTIEVVKKFQILTQSMIKMVNDFLDMAQFQLGKNVVSLKPGVEILPILDEIVTELKFQTESKGIYLKLKKPESAPDISLQPAELRKAAPAGAPIPSVSPDSNALRSDMSLAGVGGASASGKVFTIKADREKLKAALFNIIDNSVKYTPKGGVDITISSKRTAPGLYPLTLPKKNEAGGEIQNPNGQNQPSGIPAVPAKLTVVIEVKDTGIGIPKDKLDTIFDQMFKRGDQAKKTSASGTGIGLYLSGQIIKAHNGKVWVESEGEGTGSVFHIELPVD